MSSVDDRVSTISSSKFSLQFELCLASAQADFFNLFILYGHQMQWATINQEGSESMFFSLKTRIRMFQNFHCGWQTSVSWRAHVDKCWRRPSWGQCVCEIRYRMRNDLVYQLIQQGVDAWSGSHPPTKTLPFHGDIDLGRQIDVPANLQISFNCWSSCYTALFRIYTQDFRWHT